MALETQHERHRICQCPSEAAKNGYLITGAGAMGMGMAFADVVFHEQSTAHITLVDKRGCPGGHWNDAYPFVALHQPAAFYGINSAKLGSGGADLASCSETASAGARPNPRGYDPFLADGVPGRRLQGQRSASRRLSFTGFRPRRARLPTHQRLSPRRGDPR